MPIYAKDITIYGKPAEYVTCEVRDGAVVVHAWGVYPNSSVLAGQACKQFKGTFDTFELAQAEYPELGEMSHPMLQPQNTFHHLPDDGDY